jgi:hypothetical protein
MITLKIKYNSSEEFQTHLKDLRRQQSCCIRSAFNRLQDKFDQKQITSYLNGLKNLTIDSWFKQSAVYKAKDLYAASGDQKIIFGGKKNLKDYMKGLITKDQYKQNRLLPLTSIGEAPQKGNRKFRLDINNNQLIFQDQRGKVKHLLTFQRLSKDRLAQLIYIEDQTKNRKQPLTVSIDEQYVCLTFEPSQKEIKSQIPNRVLAIDTNPNSIGWSVCDIKDDKINVVNSGVIELKELNKSNKNKKVFENYEISKMLIDKVLHYQCSIFAIEDLSIRSSNKNKGRVFNKTVNNDWIRNKLLTNIEKRCWVNQIKLVKVNPAYTSVIGGVLHRNYPDPIAPTLEIARRSVYIYQKGKFYPAMPSKEALCEHWKQTAEKSFGTWKELSDWLKSSKERYRVSLDSFESKVSRFKSKRSYVVCRSLYV